MSNKSSIEDYLDWVLGLERKFPVEQWVIDGVHVWPLIRMRLNFHYFLQQQSKGQSTSGTPPQQRRSLRLIKNAWALLKFIIRPTGKVPVIGADFAAHRSLFDNKLVDKYFDPIFDSYEGIHRPLIVEYKRTEGITEKDYYKPERIMRLHEFGELLQLFGLLKAKFSSAEYQLKDYGEFLSILEKEGMNMVSYRKENVRRTVAVLYGYKWFWKTLFKKTGAKVAIGLCYYTEPLYGMILAAREMGVVSVDLQHGGQGIQHLGYAQFVRVPPGRTYNLLPHYFWCWDESSASAIRPWIEATGATHKVIQKGHPWHQFFRNRKWPELDNVKNLVIFTLQSYDMSVAQDLIDDYLAATIQATAKEFKWFVRLHPRQLHLRDILKEEIGRLGLSNDVDVDNANVLPFPAILSRASVHMTKSSGSGIEAALLGVPNVIIDEHGAARYEEYIQQGHASLYLGRDPKELAEIIRKAVAKRDAIAAPANNSNWDFILELQ
jgi:hypothetical protein